MDVKTDAGAADAPGANAGEYRFLDCGNGRRLEEFAGVRVDRPAPAAADIRPGLGAEAWHAAHLAYSRERGWEGDAPDNWHVRIGGAVMKLRPASAGQTGVFPEHAAVADETARRVSDLFSGRSGLSEQPCNALNLFAHTGLLTLRLADCPGVATTVAHVDAAKASVRTARENAALSGLETAPVRWLVDDAVDFLDRESRRGKRYSVIAADPPSFGRSQKGVREWKFDRDIEPFLAAAAKLFPESRGAALFCLTCHTNGWTPSRLAGTAKTVFPRKAGWQIETKELTLRADGEGRDLPSGVAAYVWRTE